MIVFVVVARRRFKVLGTIESHFCGHFVEVEKREKSPSALTAHKISAILCESCSMAFVVEKVASTNVDVAAMVADCHGRCAKRCDTSQSV